MKVNRIVFSFFFAQVFSGLLLSVTLTSAHKNYIDLYLYSYLYIYHSLLTSQCSSSSSLVKSNRRSHVSETKPLIANTDRHTAHTQLTSRDRVFLYIFGGNYARKVTFCPPGSIPVFSRCRLIPVKHTYEQKRRYKSKKSLIEKLKNVSSADWRDLAQSLITENWDQGLKQAVFLQIWMINSRIYFYSTLSHQERKKWSWKKNLHLFL